MELERPRVRGVSELNFESQVLGKGVVRTHALAALIILGFLRGLSVRDVEDLLEEALGEQIVGKSTVARICQERSTCGCARPTSPLRVSWSPGASPWKVRRSCLGCNSAAARATSRGWTSAATCSSAGCVRRR